MRGKGQDDMVKRTSLEGAACPVARALDAIGDWWSLLIVRDAFDGVRRFGEFQKSLGVAKNILSDRLRTLVAHEILAAAPASMVRARRASSSLVNSGCRPMSLR